MTTVQASGREYEVTGNPTMGTVQYVQEMEIEMMREHLGDEVILKMDQADEDELMADLLEEADVEDFKSMMWERSLMDPLQTICLATDEKLEPEEVEDMRALEFQELLEESEEALGGDAAHFTEKLGINLSSKVNEIQNQMSDSQTNFQGTQPPASRTLSVPSEETQETSE